MSLNSSCSSCACLNLCRVPLHFTPVRYPHSSAELTHTHPVRLLVQQSAVCSKKWNAHRMRAHIKDPIVAEPMTQPCQMLILTGKICEQFLNSWLSILRGSIHWIHRKIFFKSHMNTILYSAPNEYKTPLSFLKGFKVFTWEFPPPDF